MSDVPCSVVGLYATAHLEDRDVRCHVFSVKIDCEDLWLELRPDEDIAGVVSSATIHFGVVPKAVEFTPTLVDAEHDFVLLQRIRLTPDDVVQERWLGGTAGTAPPPPPPRDRG